ncbi:MAG TPA: AbrB/MazE/SpoVT family DNA-binding domain-containing protein [Thermoanaerobaculia bacterium]|nr:AbrB/MazE/SpoVT family DNA-binding domain-containing protein [Thermoanaerobaculia bacterium]
MSKVTSKLQVTLPKAIADRFGIRPGDQIEWETAGDAIRIHLPSRTSILDRAARLRLFDQGTQRQREREARQEIPRQSGKDRGWTREDLYERGRPR